MKRVELYAKVRRAVLVEGKSRREAAAFYGIHRNTVTKMLQYAEPPGYRRAAPRISEKLGPFTAIINRIIAEDRTAPRKQRHTCKRLFERLRDEHGYTGGLTVLGDYVRAQKLRSREVFVPLSHKPGHAQVDFGEADAIIAGKRQRIHYFCMDLPHSDACFVKAYPAEVAEAFCDGHVAAFEFFGGVPLSILYDSETDQKSIRGIDFPSNKACGRPDPRGWHAHAKPHVCEPAEPLPVRGSVRAPRQGE